MPGTLSVPIYTTRTLTRYNHWHLHICTSCLFVLYRIDLNPRLMNCLWVRHVDVHYNTDSNETTSANRPRLLINKHPCAHGANKVPFKGQASLLREENPNHRGWNDDGEREYHSLQGGVNVILLTIDVKSIANWQLILPKNNTGKDLFNSLLNPRTILQ